MRRVGNLLAMRTFFDLLPLGDGLQQRQQVAVHAPPERTVSLSRGSAGMPYTDIISRPTICPCYVECSERHFAGLAADRLLFFRSFVRGPKSKLI